jgi:hypothetical protein
MCPHDEESLFLTDKVPAIVCRNGELVLALAGIRRFVR